MFLSVFFSIKPLAATCQLDLVLSGVRLSSGIVRNSLVLTVWVGFLVVIGESGVSRRRLIYVVNGEQNASSKKFIYARHACAGKQCAGNWISGPFSINQGNTDRRSMRSAALGVRKTDKLLERVINQSAWSCENSASLPPSCWCNSTAIFLIEIKVNISWTMTATHWKRNLLRNARILTYTYLHASSRGGRCK